MSTVDRRPRPGVALPIALAVALFAALLPLLRVVAPGAWTAGVVIGVLLLLTSTWLARWAGLAAGWVSLIGAGVGGVYLTLLFAGDTALLAIVPTPATFRAIPQAVQGAIHEIVTGVAPMTAGADLSFLIVAATVVLTIALDHVVITTRMPLLASVGLIAVYLIPAVAVRTSVRLPEFVGFSVALLLLLALETRMTRRAAIGGARTPAARTAAIRAASIRTGPSRSVDAPQRTGLGTAAAIAAIAIVAAVAVTPALPEPNRPAAGFASGAAIDASLALGESLRLPEPIEVLQVQTDAANPPYLRAVTLSSFDGEVWQPDRGEGRPLEAEGALGPLVFDEGIQVIERQTTVEVVDYISPWLPVPFPATTVTGLDGSWLVLDENRTVLTRESSPQGQDYAATTLTPRPTLEQIRATVALLDEGRVPRDVTMLHGSERQIGPIRAMAREVTAAADTDYDRLVALQTWFRTTFRYSLEAPVSAGFDGSGLDAINAFLTEKEGYCVHFASAFAVMARTLGMPSRIVVGYLPGVGTGEKRDGRAVYSVSSSSLHAWPEVYFQGVGWVPFEPTASLGSATRFWPSSSGLVDDGGNPIEPVAPTEPTEAPLDPSALEEQPWTEDASALGRAADPVPALSVTVIVVMLLALPALLRTVRRRRRLSSAEWEAVPAWLEVVDTAIDLGIPVPVGESPRALGRRLVREYRVPADAMDTVVAAVEVSSYAPTDSRSVVADLPDAVRTVRAGLLASVPRSARILAVAAPRSLVVRAGSSVAARA